MKDIPLCKGYSADTTADVLKQVILSAFKSDKTCFSFRPDWGINLDKYQFNYNDTQLSTMFKIELQDELKNLDPRIKSVEVDIEKQEDNLFVWSIIVTSYDGSFSQFSQSIKN